MQYAARLRLEHLAELITLLRYGVGSGGLGVDANIELTKRKYDQRPRRLKWTPLRRP